MTTVDNRTYSPEEIDVLESLARRDWKLGDVAICYRKAREDRGLGRQDPALTVAQKAGLSLVDARLAVGLARGEGLIPE